MARGATASSSILKRRRCQAAYATACSDMVRACPTVLIALLLSSTIHLALLCILLSVPRGSATTQEPLGPRNPIQVLLLTHTAPRAQVVPAPPPRMARQGRGRTRQTADRPMPARPVVTATQTSSAIGTAPAVRAAGEAPQVDELAPIPTTPPPISAGEIMRLAKRQIAGMSHELNKDMAGRDKVFSSALQDRLDRSFAQAHAAARPEWYQAAKVEEVTTATNVGARVYRITTALGAFCVTYPKNGSRPTYGTCG